MKVNEAFAFIMAVTRHVQPFTGSRLALSVLFALTLTTSLAINCRRTPPNEDGYAPSGFDRHLLEVLACPENLTSVRLATRKELITINARIRSGTLKQWNGTVRARPVSAALIREDSRIGYEIRQGVPIMLIDEALVLDESVGRPDPAKYRGRSG